MKTLVIQLARFGDIYQSWPSLLALADDPGREVHLLVRDRFKAATIGLPSSIHIHVLPTKELIEPFYTSSDSEDMPAGGFTDWLEELKKFNFKQVINLSFSPFSSYLSSYFEMHGATIFGYTRHSDSFLNMNDDASAYFYAQVGIDRPNRIHLTQIFSMVAGVELKSSHLHPNFLHALTSDFSIEKEYFVLHVGASDLGKAMDKSQLSDLVQSFLDSRSESLVLVGVSSEQEMAQAAKPYLGSERIFDLTGKTRIEELFPIIKNSCGLIGCDSAPVHIASLLNKPIINLRNNCVNSFETGPFSERFIICELEQTSTYSGPRLSENLRTLLSSKQVQDIPETSEIKKQQWVMLQALYLGGSYPVRIPKSTATHLTQMVDWLPEVFSATKNPHVNAHQELLRSFDQALVQIEKADPLLSIVIRWFNAERIRIKPGSVEAVQSATLDCLNRLFLILSDWVRVLGEGVEFISEIEDLNDYLSSMIKDFRFVNLSPALDSLEKFLPLLTDSFPTEVQNKKVNRVRSNLEEALQKSDFARIADILEYDVLMCSGVQPQDLLSADEILTET